MKGVKSKPVEVNLGMSMLDTRSSINDLGLNRFRWIQNLAMRTGRKPCRRGGWVKLFSDAESGFQNQDLHDQLLGRQYYYDGFELDINIPPEIVSWSYPQSYPSIPGDAALYPTVFPGVYDGYPYSTDWGTHGGSTPNDPYICQAFIGWPYAYVYNPDLENTGDPYFYAYSYFSLCENVMIQGASTPGYFYGDPEPQYSQYINYVGSAYCGPEMHALGGMREAITHLSEARSASGIRRLIAGTQTRIYALDEAIGNWRILADGLGGTPQTGCSERRWSSAQIGNYLLLTNGYDAVQSWLFDDPNVGCELQAVSEVSELTELGIARARFVSEFKGFALAGYPEQDGTWVPARLFWSDYQAPLSWIPSSSSLAGFQDVGDLSEGITGIEVLGDYLIIFKERSIWRATLIGGDEMFSFQRIYSGQDCPTYRYSIVNTGDAIFYMGRSDIFSFDLYSQAPRKVEWVSYATGVVYDDETFGSDNNAGGINHSLCDLVTGGWNPITREVHFSYPTADSTCNNRTLVLDLQHAFGSIIDHGFTAYCHYQSDTRPTLRQWLFNYGACDFGELPLFAKEGDPYGVDNDPPITVTSLYNATEDPTLPPDEDSFCSALDEFEDICTSCHGSQSLFIGASASDYCLKEFRDLDDGSQVYYRESWSGVGDTYTQDGYTTILESGALDFGTPREKTLEALLIEYQAESQTIPSNLNVKLGRGSQAACQSWVSLNPKALECFDYASHATFSYILRGRFLFWRMHITGTGGGASFSTATIHVRQSEF